MSIAFDIPIVLSILRPGVYWGSMAGTRNTYAELAANWPAESGPLPTFAEMQSTWANYLADPAAFAPVPQSVMMWRVKAVLAEMGRLEEIDAAILAMKPTNPSVYFSWEYSSEITRDSPTVLSLGASFGLDLDAIFRAAAAISI